MNLFNLPPLLSCLELVVIVLALVASLWAYLLIRSARHQLEVLQKPSTPIPYTPLTREGRKRARELTRV